MKFRTLITIILLCACAIGLHAQEDNRRTVRRSNRVRRTKVETNDSIPARYPVANVIPDTEKDLKKLPLDLRNPDNIKQDTTYNEKDSTFSIATKMGNGILGTPFILSQEEYARNKMQSAGWPHTGGQRETGRLALTWSFFSSPASQDRKL